MKTSDEKLGTHFKPEMFQIPSFPIEGSLNNATFLMLLTVKLYILVCNLQCTNKFKRSERSTNQREFAYRLQVTHREKRTVFRLKISLIMRTKLS